MEFACSITEVVTRLKIRDSTLKWIDLSCKNYSDKDLVELTDCLLTHPDVVTHVCMSYNQLTDETGVKLARYIAASSTVQYLGLSYNQLGSATYLAVAAALQVNTSLQYLCLCCNQVANGKCIDVAFINALVLNPMRPVKSIWGLYSWDDEFKRLKKRAKELGHPSLQALLAITIY